MKTDDLIAMLARESEPMPKPRWRLRMALALGLGLGAALVVMAAWLGVRPDIATAIMPVMMKAAFSAAAAAVMLPLALRLMRPGRPLGWRLGAIGLFVALALLTAAVALMGKPTHARMDAWLGGGFPWCLALVPVLAAPTAALLIWLTRASAPTELTLSGAAIGGLSGGIGAMAYAMYCPVDSVAFVTTWYVVAIAICAALGAVLGARLLRW